MPLAFEYHNYEHPEGLLGEIEIPGVGELIRFFPGDVAPEVFCRVVLVDDMLYPVVAMCAVNVERWRQLRRLGFLDLVVEVAVEAVAMAREERRDRGQDGDHPPFGG